MGKKVMATDTAQEAVGVVVDGLEDVVVDKADDAADELKARAARAGGRSAPRTKKSAAKKSAAKKSAAKKSTAKKSTAKKSTARTRRARS
jgi:topoisomerase IA-like protein